MSISVYDLNIKADSDFAICKILELIFEEQHTTAKTFKIDSEKGLIFYWVDKREGYDQLPIPMRAEELKPIILKWLKTVEYPKQGTGDGSYKKGWRLYNKVDDFYAIFAIKPEWTYYSK